VLGTAPCGTTTCSEVLGTIDGGTSWSVLGVVGAPIAKLSSARRPGITEIRFATPEVGWAFGPELFRTTDGGETFESIPVPGGGKQVLDLAANSTEAFAVVSACRFDSFCHAPLTFWRTTDVTGDSWTRIALNLPANNSADVAVYGQSVYVVEPPGEHLENELYASTDGLHFSPRPVPCDTSEGVALVQALPTSATDVYFVCVGAEGFNLAEKTVYRSTDTGTTDKSTGTLNPNGVQSELAVSPSGNLALASTSDGSFMYVNDNHATTWTMVIGIPDGGAGWNDVVYTTDREAWVVYAPADSNADIGELFVTHDGGHHWSVSPL
jgi:photosystem II stability/assembly factor-like uncharacterized protein